MIADVILVAAAEEEHIDRTHSWIWPEGYEIIFGAAASLIDLLACSLEVAGPSPGRR